MRDRTSGPGDDRHRTERLSRAPGEEWTPEQDSPATDEWSPGDATPGRRTPRTPRPEERLPGEPGRAEPPRGGTGGWISGEGTGGEAGAGTADAETGGSRGPTGGLAPDAGGTGLAGGRGVPEAGGTGPAGTRTPDAGGTAPTGGRTPDTSGAGPAGGRLPGAFGPGREGLTGDDRTPDDTPAPPPGPAGAGAGQWRGAEETGQWRGTEQAGQWHGTEGLRPGTEDMGAGTDEGFGASHRAEREAISEEDRMPDNGLGAPAPGEASQRDAMTTDTPGRDTWPTAPGAPTRDAPRPATAPATGAVGTEPAAPAGTPSTAQPAPSGHGSPLIAREEVEEWQRRMREVVGGFVDQPKGAVERADRTLEEIAARFSEAVTRRRRTLRMSWEGSEEHGPGAGTDTEQLRLALRDYRELAERLLHS
ncbi:MULTISPECIES: hypothetical protein [Streptomyces]|uniref:hypothetical protein n=1 Tax=Streptomyces TaxID=1883 RepID=UPI0019890BD1|nr:MULTISPECIES: hypothetical protein [Streptomyces]GGS02685.1 hypothetical protein GCM10010236_66690 [Streptomyces eurythermus]